jgi:hypothetical protein
VVDSAQPGTRGELAINTPCRLHRESPQGASTDDEASDRGRTVSRVCSPPLMYKGAFHLVLSDDGGQPSSPSASKTARRTGTTTSFRLSCAVHLKADSIGRLPAAIG